MPAYRAVNKGATNTDLPASPTLPVTLGRSLAFDWVEGLLWLRAHLWVCFDKPGAAPQFQPRVVSMAIYSLNHKSIGKETQPRPYTAAAHVGYITRPKAMSRLEGERMPVSKSGAMGFMRSAENGDRVNGRVADKVMLALPRELSPEQRAELVRVFANEVTKGKAPWLAAFHDKGKDAHNPHCHLVIRDRDPETGRRVFGMSERGSTQRLRQAWTQHANGALERAGSAERIDDRTLEAQGKPGPATIHEGPKPRAMARGGRRPQSQQRLVRNAPGARRPSRRVDYPALDQGRSRADHNADLKGQQERDGWDAVDADNRRRELDELRSIHHPPEAQNMRDVPKRRSPLHAGTNPEVPKQAPERRPEAAPVPPRTKPKVPKPDLISDSSVPGGPAPLKVARPDLGLAVNKIAAPGKAQKPSVGPEPRPDRPKAPKPDLGLAPRRATAPGKAQKPDLGPSKGKPKAPQRGKSQEPDLER